MSRVRSKNNRSTELLLRALLIRSGIRGWKVRAPNVFGNPDFVFTLERIAVFVDGAFWHGAPNFKRFPKSRVEYWRPKIEGNRKRDKIVTFTLRRHGWAVLRFWDYDLRDHAENVIERIKKKIQQRGRI